MQPVPATEYEILSQGHAFLEAPRLSPAGDLWFADLTGTGVYRKRHGHALETMLAERQWVGGLVFDASGHVLCGGRGGLVALDPESGAVRTLLGEIDGAPIIAVNDMEADGRGGLFAGPIDFVSIMERGEAPAPGTLFHLSAAGGVTVLRRDVFASNGLALSPCGQWLYHSETSRGVWRYPIGADGLPGKGTLVVTEEDSDGLALDRDGNLWLACWSTGRLMHYAPDGTALKALTFPYPHVVSVAFGAGDPHALHVTTGGNVDHPHAGAVLRLRVEVPGLAGGMTRLRALAGG